MLGENFVKAELARISWIDGGDCGLEGMRGVAFVIRNRQRAGFYDGDWVRLLSNHQNYAAIDRQPSFEIPNPTRNYAFAALLQQIDGIFDGTVEDDATRRIGQWDPTRIKFEEHSEPPVALYYGQLHFPNIRPWFLENISLDHERHQRVATIGTLTFFS